MSGDSIHLVSADLDKGNDGNLDVFSMVASGDNGAFGGLTNLAMILPDPSIPIYLHLIKYYMLSG